MGNEKKVILPDSAEKTPSNIDQGTNGFTTEFCPPKIPNLARWIRIPADQWDPRCVENVPGVYIIHCVHNGVSYAGSAEVLRRRLREHFNKLNRGAHEVHLMQKDWNFLGSKGFEVWFCPCSVNELCRAEVRLILSLACMQEQGGYNLMIAGMWGLCARIYDTERKLSRSGKCVFPTGFEPRARLGEIYAKTFAQDVNRLSDEVAEKMADLARRYFTE